MIFRALPTAAPGSAFSALYPETPVPYTVPRSNFYLPGWEPGYENYALPIPITTEGAYYKE
eukprot:CAMPEP_0172153512 /NCGR_PEP_ID=MMETSP1050-20130122/1489_1 /TAXON_ID=233186 /ORGANISM="Cryptomonas curvata, Strain CCAP979/52" /LENGTH=60 /DNA_ID=CAMNT_0012822063 /DNA_START=13 /DNA_END=195 /DNA_ORIENTATION=-